MHSGWTSKMGRVQSGLGWGSYALMLADRALDYDSGDLGSVLCSATGLLETLGKSLHLPRASVSASIKLGGGVNVTNLVFFKVLGDLEVNGWCLPNKAVLAVYCRPDSR